MSKITPFLWFQQNNAEEAMHYYIDLFKDGRVLGTMPGPDGKAMAVTFELRGQKFMGLNAGPHDSFNDAVSFFVNCETQEDVDHLYDTMAADGGTPSQCGWINDKFGVTWQIIPDGLIEMVGNSDPVKAARANAAMMKMQKIDIATIRRAFEGQE